MNTSSSVHSASTAETEIVLDGFSLTLENLYQIGYGWPTTQVKLCPEAAQNIIEGRKVVEEILQKGETKYGINTGFGNFATVKITEQHLNDLQLNLIRSHSAGVGEPLSVERARMLLALRINVFAKGNSGIRLQTVKQLVDALNKNCISYIPCKGTVGASGDLAPLAHMALGMLGEGKMWNPTAAKYETANEVLKQHGLVPIELEAKEGLALINGTQFISALGAEALMRAKNLAKQADVVAALTLETLQGSHKAFDARIHKARPHKGQQSVAERMRNLLLEFPDENTDLLLHEQHHHHHHHQEHQEHQEHNSNSGATTTTTISQHHHHHGATTTGASTLQRVCSEISASHKNCTRVQDSYTLRCVPQVHGVVHDTIEFVQRLLETEFNSATDNPMVFKDENGSMIDGFHDKIVSGGNFHGEYPAKACDYLGIAIQELANISERRIARLVDQSLSNLPAFLVKQGGLNSGFMIAHCTAAALTSENKVLVHPSSNDTLSTSASKEDHVSMGGFAARKAIQIVENVEQVVAIELLSACQALDFLRPLKTTRALEAVHALVRTKVTHYEKDRYMAPDIEAVHHFLITNSVWKAVEPHVIKNTVTMI